MNYDPSDGIPILDPAEIKGTHISLCLMRKDSVSSETLCIA